MADQVGVMSGGRLIQHTHTGINTGGQLDPELALNPFPKVEFGDGSDGDVVVNVALYLTRDMQFNNLHVSGDNLWANGYKIKVRNKLTIDAGRYIFANGQLDQGVNGAAGIGGTGGLIAITPSRPHTYLPTAGAAGASSGAAGATPSNGGAGGGVGLAGTTLLERRIWAGAGGGGGGAVGNAPAAGATAGAILFGAAGGAGGNAQRIALNHQKAGGGGGAGGGCLEIWSYEIENNGTLYAAGGVGGAGEGDANAQAGGGGGGGGGAVLIYYAVLTGLGIGAYTALGGIGGTSFGGAADGNPGSNGVYYAMQIGV